MPDSVLISWKCSMKFFARKVDRLYVFIYLIIITYGRYFPSKRAPSLQKLKQEPQIENRNKW
jgi:hypothetical protein